VHQADHQGTTALSHAAWVGDHGAVQILLESKATLTDADRVVRAVSRHEWRQLKRLVDAKADVNGTDCRGDTHLALVASRGTARAVRLLVGAKADVDGNDTSVPLARAAQDGCTGAVRCLIEAKAELDKYDHSALIRPLRGAVCAQRASVIQILLVAKVDVNAADPHGGTPLIDAAHQGYTDGVRALLDAKGDARATRWDGQAALDYAEKCGHASVVQVLREYLDGTEMSREPP
jgi:ankyrin repeat protein